MVNSNTTSIHHAATNSGVAMARKQPCPRPTSAMVGLEIWRDFVEMEGRLGWVSSSLLFNHCSTLFGKCVCQLQIVPVFKAQIPLRRLPRHDASRGSFGEVAWWLVTGKSPTWITDKSWGSFWVSDHRDLSRCFEKCPWQVGSICVGETGKSATSATRHGAVGDVADNQREHHGFVAEKSA